jgi:hypothetical protein
MTSCKSGCRKERDCIMKLRLMLVIMSCLFASCDGPEFPLSRPSNPAPTTKSGTLGINVSGAITEFDSVIVKYYPNYRLHINDSVPQPLLVIVADSSTDTVRLNLANALLDTGTYYVTNNMNPGSTFAYFQAPVFFPPPSYYGSWGYALVSYGHITITDCDTTKKVISGLFSFDENIGSPQARVYLDGTFSSIPYQVVR